MTLYAEYIKEREGFECLEYERSFITFRIDGKCCYIRDCYIKDGFRKSGLLRMMCQSVADLAKDRGCDHLLISVCPVLPGCDEMVQKLIHFGCKLHTSVHNLIYYKREI